jgi:hypothetical protein
MMSWAVTRSLNGGINGLAEREQWLQKRKAELGSTPIVLAPAEPPVVLPTVPRPPDVPKRAPAPAPARPSITTPQGAPSERSSRQFSLRSSKGKADTMFEFALSFTLRLTAGGALIWFCKDKIQALVIGGKALAAKLEAKALR